MSTRNRIGIHDDLDTTIQKLEGQRDVKAKWQYTRQARHCNLVIGMLKCQKALEERLNGALLSE